MPNGEQSAMKKLFKRLFSWMLQRKHRASSTSRQLDSQPITTTTNVPSTIVSPLPVSSAQPSTAPRPMGIVHSSPILNKAPSHPTSYAMREAPTQAPIQASIRTPTNASIQTRDSLPFAGAAGIGYSPRTVTESQTTGKLPSQVEKTLAACTRFRILLVGNTGVGKSSLISYVFNIVFNVSLPNSNDGAAIDIAHDRVGEALISHEYYSDLNPRFILHDSMGFEPGNIDKSEIVKSFLLKRGSGADLPDQVHAIWLCIETPRKGARLLQTGDENLLALAKELKIPVVVVLTKYDLLVMEHYRACGHKLSVADKKIEATRRAEEAFIKVTKELEVPFAPVSTRKEALKEYGEKMLVKLTQVTQRNLLDIKGSLRALWATAQQINAGQKFELSVSEGLKRYWRKLDDSDSFRGHRLVDCIGRIHDDILKIWNFNDPSKELIAEEFFKGMMGLVKPLSDEVIRNQQGHGIAGGDDSLVFPALGSIIETVEFQFLCSKYQKGVPTATYLAAYIVDLTLVLYGISTVVTANPPKSLSADLVMAALTIYKPRSSEIHDQVKKVASSLKLEEKIESLIQGEVGSTIRSVT